MFNAFMKVWDSNKRGGGGRKEDRGILLDNVSSMEDDENSTQKTKRLFKNWVLRFMTYVLWFTIIVIISQQLVLLSTEWHLKTEDYQINLKRWNHDCGDPNKPPMDPNIISICTHLKVLINTYPFIRAIHAVINGWNSCITMPCSDLFNTILNNTAYKILVGCILIAIANYLYKGFGLAKDKTGKWKTKMQLQETLKRQLAAAQQIHHQSDMKQVYNPLFYGVQQQQQQQQM